MIAKLRGGPEHGTEKRVNDGVTKIGVVSMTGKVSGHYVKSWARHPDGSRFFVWWPLDPEQTS